MLGYGSVRVLFDRPVLRDRVLDGTRPMPRPVATFVSAAFALGLLTGCKREQTVEEAMTILCRLPSTMDSSSATELAAAAKPAATLTLDLPIA